MNNTFIGNVGYLGLKVQTDKDTASTPDVFVPLYSETMMTTVARHRQNSIKGNRMLSQDMHAGMRSHEGEVTVLGEPNTIARFLDMLMTKGTTTGADPYTHPFTVGDSEKYYTVDIKKGAYVERFIGVKASTFEPSYADNVMQAKFKLTALKTFKMGVISATPTGAGPYVVVLNTDSDPSPTNGLVVGDVLVFDDGTTQIDGTIAAITDGTTLSITEDVTSYGAGDSIRLKALTPSYALLTPFSRARTEYRFEDDAATALTTAHTPLDDGTTLKLIHANQDDAGTHTTGSYDPSDIRRTTFDGEVVTTRVYESLDEQEDDQTLKKKALVVRMYAGNTTQHELRITFNHLKIGKTTKEIASDTVVSVTQELKAQYDTTDGQGIDVKVINGIATI